MLSWLPSSLRRFCLLSLGVVLLLGLGGCRVLNPVAQYEAAGRQLRFSLDRVEPRLELAFPIEESRLRLRLEVGVDNPTGQALRTREVSGNLRLRVRDEEHAVGIASFPEGAAIPAHAHSTLKVDLVFRHRDLRAAWAPLSHALLRHEPATWTLAGEARFEVLGITFGVPFRTHRETGP